MLKQLKITGLNGAGMRSDLYVPAHGKLETHMGYITHLKHDIICFSPFAYG